MTALIAIFCIVCGVIALGVLLGLAYIAIVLWCIAAAIWDGWKESRQGRVVG